jgi:hypothetical protein
MLQEAYKISYLILPHLYEKNEFTDLVIADPEFSIIASHEGQLDPMLLTPSGGGRIQIEALLGSLFSAAYLKIFLLGLQNNESTFVRTVIEGFEELRCAIRGERIRAYTVTGISRVALPEGAQI